MTVLGHKFGSLTAKLRQQRPFARISLKVSFTLWKPTLRTGGVNFSFAKEKTLELCGSSQLYV